MKHTGQILSKIKLFCLPYAGGSATVYYKWKESLDARIELMPVETSGRGRRINEPRYDSMSDCIKDILEIIGIEILNGKYALYGHSMGALIVCELMNVIHKSGLEMPVHVFLSGSSPPHIKNIKKISHLPDSEFIMEIMKFGGTPKDICENKELMDFFIPILRSDYKLIEEYQNDRVHNKWDVPISVMIGLNDESVPLDSAPEWAGYTSKECNIHTFPGGHFFIHDFFKDIVAIINNTLC